MTNEKALERLRIEINEIRLISPRHKELLEALLISQKAIELQERTKAELEDIDWYEGSSVCGFVFWLQDELGLED